MRNSLSPIARAILHALLDQHEQPQRQQVRRVRLTRQHYPAYFSQYDATPRQQTNAALLELAEAGVLQLRWRKWEERNWLEWVDLVAERADMLYPILQRTPHHEREQALRNLLARQSPRGDWHSAVLDWLREQLASHRSVAPFDLGDPQKNADLFKLLDAVATLQTLTMERTLSTRLFGNSKRLEMLRPALLAILRRHAADAEVYGNDDVALLRAYHLERMPLYIPLAGPLILHTPAREHETVCPLLDMSPFVRGLALPGNTLRDARIAACEAKVLITVENGTSFQELLAVRPGAFLVICTGGFASPSLITLLQHIRMVRPDLLLLHWGDLDAGGLRILQHLRMHLDVVLPLMMDMQTFAAHRAMTQPLSRNDRTVLQQLLEAEPLADCHELINGLLEVGQKLEQESIAATDVVRAAETTFA